MVSKSFSIPVLGIPYHIVYKIVPGTVLYRKYELVFLYVVQNRTRTEWREGGLMQFRPSFFLCMKVWLLSSSTLLISWQRRQGTTVSLGRTPSRPSPCCKDIHTPSFVAVWWCVVCFGELDCCLFGFVLVDDSRVVTTFSLLFWWRRSFWVFPFCLLLYLFISVSLCFEKINKTKRKHQSW